MPGAPWSGSNQRPDQINRYPRPMLTYEDCRDLSDLTQEEIDAIMEHENMPAMIAVDLGNYLLHSPDGIPVLKRMILDDIDAARARRDHQHVLRLRLVLRRFVESHPLHEGKTA